MLRCVQPASGARLVAGVLHLAPFEHATQGAGGKAPALTAGTQVHGVRAGLDFIPWPAAR